MMHKGITLLYTLFRTVILPAVILLTLGWNVANASGTEPYQHELRGKLKKGDTLIVKDEKFRNPAYDWSKIKHHSVQDYVLLDLLPDSLKSINKPFSCELDLKVEYWSQPDQEDPVVISSVPLKITYDTATGAVYQSRDIYAFKNAHRIKVTVNNITCTGLDEVPGCFILTGQIFIERQYTLEQGAMIKPFVTMEEVLEEQPGTPGGISAMSLTAPVPTATANRLKLAWTHAVGSEEVDLEWTTISSTSTWGTTVAGWENGTIPMNIPAFVALFRNNSTRITTEEQEYTISLVYSDDYLLFRMRTVTYTAGVRVEGEWSYVYRPAGSSTDKFSIIKLPTAWHEPNLNWSYTGSFAEGGKKKEVVSYFDGTMRNRQTVTVNNSNISTVAGSSENVIVQEEIYDEFGRAVASMLPAPLKNENALKYYPGAYQNSAGKAYNFKNVYGVLSGATAGCINTPLPVNTAFGAGRYYSPQNDFRNNPAERYHNYIPDAEGFPLSVRRYSADKTNRLILAGGVGPALQPNPSATDPHTTRTYYSKPGQWELDRIFGSDVGLASHYMKSTVIDPNGQASVSYSNISGKVIATALAGGKSAATEALPSLPQEISVTQPLLQPADFVFDPVQLKMKGTTTYVTPITDNVVLDYDIQQLVHKYTQGITICSNCYYALTITVHDDCGVEKFKTTTPVDIGSKTANCGLIANKQGSIPVTLAPGEYYITYELALSPDVISDYTEAYIQQNTNLRKQFSFIINQLNRADFKGCFSECTTCLTSLGTQANFSSRILAKLTASGVDVTTNAAALNTWITGLYNALLSNCQAIQATCTESPCDRYKKLMLADVTPGGQYALFDQDGNALEQDINVLFTKFRVVFPEATSGTEYESNKFTNADGVVVSPNDPMFSLQMLVKYWQPSWAEKFLIHHPEICKLDFCNSNSTYLTWDEKVKSRIITAADIPVILPGRQYQQTVANWLLEADPYFKTVGSPGAAYYTQMYNNLQNYSQNVLLMYNGSNVKSMTQYVDYMLYCADPTSNTSSGNPKDWNNCTPVAICRVTDKEWQLYRDIYFEMKERFYKLKRDELCGEACPVGRPIEMTAPGCPSPSAFVLTKFANDSARLTYEGGLPDRGITVTLYYPPEYSALTKQESFYFSPGQYSKDFLISPAISIGTVLVKSVTCSPVTLTPRTCSGVGATLNVPSTTKQTGPNSFEVLSGSVLTTYKVTKGYVDVPDTTSCSGTVTRAFYNCLFIKYPSVDHDIEFTNVWMTTCVTGGSAFMAGDESQLVQAQPASGGASAMLLPPNSVDCSDIYESDFSIQYNGTDPHGYYIYDLIYLGPVIPDGLELTYVITYNGTEVCRKVFNSTSNNTQDFWVHNSIVGSNNEYFYQTPNAYISFDCTGVPNVCSPTLLYKTSRFPDYTNSQVDVATLKGENALKVTAQINSACDAQADNWMLMLKPCLDGRAVNLATRNDLRAKLVEVCKLGGDIDRIFGASTAAPGKATAQGYTSFRQVIVGVLGASAMNMECNPWMLESPFPYKTQPQSVEREISNTNAAICAELAAEKVLHQQQSPGVTFHQFLTTRYGSAMKLTVAELATLEKGCTNCRFLLDKNLVLPAFMEPGAKGCVTATEFTAAITALTGEGITGFSSSHANYEEVYTNYLNHRWGFTLPYADYKAYEAKVNTNPATAGLLCNAPVYTSITLDPYDCLMSVITMAVNNGKREYEAYIEEEKKIFRRNYVATCGATSAKVNITANQQYYHYTLYYYDQAGNLVRTVPPAGVSLLTEDWQFDAVNATRGNSTSSCNYAGPAGNTDKAAALLQLSSSLSTAGRSVEMWLYNPATTSGQVLAVTSDKKYLFNTCINDRYLNVEIQTMSAASAAEAEITLSNHLTVDMQPLMPLRPWTHIVFVSTQVMASQPFDVYVNGVKCAVVANPANDGCGWEISSSGSAAIFPENIAVLKQLRMYSRLLPAAEILNNSKEGCLNITGVAPLLWARFNTPTTGSETVLVPGSTVETQHSGYYPAHRLPSSYAYNSLNAVEEQTSPDGGRSMSWYDEAGRVVISQNEEQRLPAAAGGIAGRYTYMKYDKMGRVIETGEKTGGSDLTSLHHKPLALDWFVSYNLTGTNAQITRSYYDAVPIGQTGIVTGLIQNNLRKRIAVSSYSETSATADQSSYYDYDLIGNVKSIFQFVKEIGLKRVEYEYDLISNKVNFVAYQRSGNDQFFYQYKYDAENRLVEAKSGITASTDWRGIGTILNGKIDAIYRYYKHGPLARMELGDAKLQGQDYVYTLQGNLKGVNGHYLNPATEVGVDGANGVGKDVVSYSLGYFANDYKPVEASAGAFPLKYQAQSGDLTGHSLYNGNISNSTVSLSMPAAGLPTAYSYRYDQLNRLVKQRQHNIPAGTTNWGLAQITEAYMENVGYDANGNIETYYRKASDAGTAMDDLKYIYPKDANNNITSNRLRHVKDVTGVTTITEDIESQPDNNYSYDKIGNMIADADAGITKVDWTLYGKIGKISKSGSSIEYAYDASGNRVYKKHTVGTIINKTWYFRDANGNTLAVYGTKNGAAQTYWQEQHLYGSSRLGMWLPDMNVQTAGASALWSSVGLKRYELTNHLGNVLAIISDAAKVNDYPVVTNAQDYYPFGMVQPGRSYKSVAGVGYRYGFNGHEKSDEVKGEGNHYTAQYWEMDPRIARRWERDPVVKQHESPYAIIANNPIWFRDPNGADSTLYNSLNGKLMARGVTPQKDLTAIWTVDPTAKGFDKDNPWKTAQKLTYTIGAKTDRKGITGSTLRMNHPLANKGWRAGGQVYEEHLLDMTSEFLLEANRWLLYFRNEGKEFDEILSSKDPRMSRIRGTALIIQASKFQGLVGIDKPFDLKSRTRSSINHIPTYAGVVIGQYSFFKGRLMHYDDYGNAAFGAWARAFGYDLGTSTFGADVSQFFDTFSTDPGRDQMFIKYGFNFFSDEK